MLLGWHAAYDHIDTTLFLINADVDHADATTWALAGARTIPMMHAIIASQPGIVIDMKRLRKIAYPESNYMCGMNWWIDRMESGALDKSNPSFAWLIRYALDHGLARDP